MNQIAIEDIATLFASEFVKFTSYKRGSQRVMPKDFLKMNHGSRRKVIERVLDSIEGNLRKISVTNSQGVL